MTLAAVLALAAVAVGPGPEAPGARARAPALGSCHACHVDLGGALAAPAEAFAGDVHAQPGLGCTACHGGDASSDDPAVAMSRARGFRGVPAQGEVPALCGSCHANPTLVKRYDPNLPTDQLAQYRTSRHAMALAAGDPRAAVCTSCHGAHGIRSARDSRSPVYPTHVVDTCARCHAKPGGGGPVEAYRTSVHQAALASGDLSAPSCPRCHGSHGATPPGVESVSAVCGQCHPLNLELFRASPHEAAFDAASLGACEACHGNHAIVRPSDAWVGVGDDTVCGRCHSSGDGGGEAARAMGAALSGASALLERGRAQVESARQRGMLMVDAQVALDDANQQLVHARTLVHTAAPSRVEERTDAAAGAARKALADAQGAFAEIRYRRTGLLVALALILAAVVLLGLRIRRLDARRRPGP